jgi:hypothetical protein
MSRHLARGLAFAAVVIAGCSLFTDLGGFADGDGAPPDAAVAADAEVGPPSDATNGVDAPPVAPLDFAWERPFALANGASVPVPLGYTTCLRAPRAEWQALIGTKARPDLGDLRLFNQSEELPRTIDVTPSGTRVLCFRVARAIDAGASDDGYVMRYGNAELAPPPSASAQLFPFFDDFDGTALTQGRWLEHGAPVVAGGLLTLPMGAEHGVTTFAAVDGVPEETSLEMRVRLSKIDATPLPREGDTFHYWFGFQRTGDFSASKPWSIFVARGSGQIRAEHNSASDACATNCSSPTVGQTTGFRHFRIDRLGSGVHFREDAIDFSAAGSSGDQSIMIRSFLLDADLEVDWVRARPFMSPEPEPAFGAEVSLR